MSSPIDSASSALALALQFVRYVMRTIVLATLVWACSSPKPSGEAPPPVVALKASPAGDANSIELPGDANGLYWDSTERTLYLTDDTHVALVAWSDAGGFKHVAPLPTPALGSDGMAKVSYGGLVRLPDGGFAITSFGFGSDGGVLVVDAKHAVRSVPNLDRTRRRIGIARASDGTLYDAYFIANHGGKRGGGLAKLDLATGETDIIATGLAKPIGVVASERGLFVSDQDSGSIYAIKDGALVSIATGLSSPDLLTMLPDGSFVTGGKSGDVVRIALDGTHTTIVSGYEQVRGIAYDAVGKRLFVVEHSRATSNHKLHIVPLAL